MNTQLHVLDRAAANRLSRPQFSPLGRSVARAAVARPLSRVRSSLSASAQPVLPPPADHVPAWHRSFLDRLQPAVTRYHE